MPGLLDGLYALTHRDAGGVLAGPAAGFESDAATAVTVNPELIGVAKGWAFVVESMHVRGAAGIAVGESFTGGNIRENMSFTAPVIILGGSWFLKASAIFDAGVNANSCFFNVQGYVIPRGNLSLMSLTEA
jgi:hypothetical protein